MKQSRCKQQGLYACAILAGFLMPVEYAWAGNGHSFKLVKVGVNPLGARINIQIQPETSGPVPKVPFIPSNSAPAAPDKYDWFWSGITSNLASASLLNLNKAEQHLSDEPQKSKNLAPSLADMRRLVANYGTDILMATLGKDVSPALVLAVIGVESSGKPGTVSPAGAVGLMQLIPETAKRFNVSDSTDARQNIAGGVAYLDWLLKEFNNDAVLALAGYNAGENAIKKYKGVPPYAETRGYVPKVVAAWKVAKALCKTPPKYVMDGCVFDLNPKITQR